MMHASQEQLKAAEVRRRLMYGVQKPIVKIAKPEVPAAQEEPITYRIANYNAHVIDYRKWKLQEELERPIDFDKRSMPQILAAVLENYRGITADDLRGPRRQRKLIKPRHEAMLRIYLERPDLSLPAIGRFFNRDHTTILAAVRKLQGNPLKRSSGPGKTIKREE